jgi:DNA invertase Pin-like site-specific DNA recombinase
MPTALRAALYARVSTKDKSQHTENQLAQLRTFCASSGWTVATEFVDQVSGKHSDRKQFKAHNSWSRLHFNHR